LEREKGEKFLNEEKNKKKREEGTWTGTGRIERGISKREGIERRKRIEKRKMGEECNREERKRKEKGSKRLKEKEGRVKEMKKEGEEEKGVRIVFGMAGMRNKDRDF